MNQHHDELLSIRSDLRQANAILAGIAEGYGDFRSPEEIRGGVAAARDKVRDAWRKALRASLGPSAAH